MPASSIMYFQTNSNLLPQESDDQLQENVGRNAENDSRNGTLPVCLQRIPDAALVEGSTHTLPEEEQGQGLRGIDPDGLGPLIREEDHQMTVGEVQRRRGNLRAKRKMREVCQAKNTKAQAPKKMTKAHMKNIL